MSSSSSSNNYKKNNNGICKATYSLGSTYLLTYLLLNLGVISFCTQADIIFISQIKKKLKHEKIKWFVYEYNEKNLWLLEI